MTDPAANPELLRDAADGKLFQFLIDHRSCYLTRFERELFPDDMIREAIREVAAKYISKELQSTRPNEHIDHVFDLLRDAARYRWLRARENSVWFDNYEPGEELDELIDAELACEQKDGLAR